MLLPEIRPHEGLRVTAYPIVAPETAEIIVPHTNVEVGTGTIAAFRMIEPNAKFQYVCRFDWAD